MKRHHAITLATACMMLCIGHSMASAAEYKLIWKSELSEGSVGMCKIKVSGQPIAGATTVINSWERISLPFSSYTPQNLFAKFKYSPTTGCSKLLIEAVCHIKPDGTEWIQKLEISPCQSRTISLRDFGMRQY